MIRQDIFDLCNDQPRRSDSVIPSSSPQAGSSSMTRQRATRIRGGGGPDPGLSRTTMTKSDEEVVFLVHPSDLINAALLSQNPSAKVALTHDDVWCSLLRDNFPKLNYAILTNVARSYTNTIEYDCVSLEKISDPSNVFEESSHPLQGIGTSALQGTLTVTPPDDDYTPVPATIPPALPHELMERILLLLDTKSMLKCRLINREFNAIIQSSTLVQYYLACKVAGVIDNPKSLLSYAERLEALKKREDAWRKLKPVFEMTIEAFDHYSHKLTAGYYFVNTNEKDLYRCHLPSSPEDNPQWFRIPGHGPEQSWSGSILKDGMAVYEHDLLVSVIFSEVGNQADMHRHSLDLVLLKFSTGEYHPLAHHPLIHVQRSPSARAYTSVKIVGDHLALLVHGIQEDCSKLFIFDWKTGHKRLQHKATESAYQCSVPVFVSPELLLVPNRILFHFEIWRIPSHPNHNPPTQILSLQIPAVSDSYFITNIYCHGELSPFLHSMPYFPPRPFFPSSEDSIITINLRFDGPQESAYKLVMHRRALLDIIHKWTSPSLPEQERLSTWFTNELTVHKVADPDDGSVRLAAQSELVSTVPQPGSSPRTRDSSTSHISADSSYLSTSSGPASSTSRYNILQVQWADWGSPISRWFQLNANLIAMPQSNGQRCVFLDPNPDDKTKCEVSVADFNPHNVMAQLRGREGGGNSGNNGEGKKKGDEDELELLDDDDGVFSEEVYMGLKCVVYHAPGEYEFDAVMMDEERLLGYKFDYANHTGGIKVLYFG
ncbi:hypothetical protein M378DRAFT_162378 [Amanita muscaria Koide BX008]|uniref:F-box domain-containing protein n=1 Tax=Amanita muscaria (strain Koide BX008) TaxID=946122 RepID=A0A0C2WTR4_AMAMK|nr:hypothetical protein M378DRAFT_162378 [Amanita muscaria Koide BX008]